MAETSPVEALGWNERISGLPGAHVLQTREWGQVKARLGWQALPREWLGGDGRVGAAGLVLQRSLSLAGIATPVRVAYIPKGPLLNWGDAGLRARVLDDLQAFARRQGAIFLKIDPDVLVGTGIPGTADACEDRVGAEVAADLTRRGWRFSAEQIQFRNTVRVDLQGDDEALLDRMKQKMRYNIHLAERKGVQVRAGSTADLPLLYQIYAETSIRDGFVIRDEGYYRSVWGSFIQAGLAEPLIAEVAGEPVAGLIVFRFAGTAWYLYGMSRQAHREKMPNALLQWEAIRRARAAGCAVYDLWGAPNEFSEADPMWGVFRFKEGLGGRVIRTIGAWDYPVNRWMYSLYTQTLPRLLDLMRRRGRQRTRRELQPV